jgi:adenine-specific DNA-methyltransferase
VPPTPGREGTVVTRLTPGTAWSPPEESCSDGWSRRLIAHDEGDYRWVAPSDPRLSEIRPLEEVCVVGDRASAPRNLLIQGDAFYALSSLARLPECRRRFVDKVKLCYIDPPFNTGENFAHYSDALDQSVWLAMMWERLVEIRGVLAKDGSVWVHVDDSSQHHARYLLDEVFGTEAFVATVIWQKRTSRDNRKAFSSMHDYIHVYSPLGPVEWKQHRNALPDHGHFWNPDNDPRGPWRSVPMTAQAGHATPSQFYSIVSPAGVKHDPPPGRCWTYTRKRFTELLAEGRIYWPRDGRGKPRLKRYDHEVSGLAPFTIWTADEVGENASAKKDLLRLFHHGSIFDTPKPEALLERIIHVATDPGELVLDCFLGSGTTASVAHKMGRYWVGVERSRRIIETVALPRLRRVVEGTDAIGISQPLQWKGGGGFTVLRVGATRLPTTVRGISRREGSSRMYRA